MAEAVQAAAGVAADRRAPRPARTGRAVGPSLAGGMGSIAVGWVLRKVSAQMVLRRSRRIATTAMP